MKKKILVMYARYGSGHAKIAEYVAKYIEENNNDYEVLLLDMTNYGNSLGNFGVKVMDFVAKYRPEFIFNACYEIMDHRISVLGNNRFSKMSFDNNRLRTIISKFNPDITISTHFYCSSIINYYNELKIINSKILTIITDYRIHACWIKNHKKEDGYIVGNNVVKKELIKRGVNSNKIYSFGLPLNLEQTNNLESKEKIYKRYNISGKKKIYLFFGGSTAGSMYYYDYFKTLAKMNLNADIIFISGKNEKLKTKCKRYVDDNNISNIKVLGFTNDVFNLLKISDLVISKPGGATITECLEMKNPMLLVPGVGGQEKYNARFIVRKKYGFKVRGLYKFKKVLNLLEKNPDMIEKIHERMKKINKNDSIIKINDLISKM